MSITTCGLVVEEVVIQDISPGGGVIAKRKHRRDWSLWKEDRSTQSFGQRTATQTLGYSARKTVTLVWCWRDQRLLMIQRAEARDLLEIRIGEFMVERHWQV